jgi:hypothetical protein
MQRQLQRLLWLTLDKFNDCFLDGHHYSRRCGQRHVGQHHGSNHWRPRRRIFFALVALEPRADLASALGLRLPVLDTYLPSAAQWRLWATLFAPSLLQILMSSRRTPVVVELTLCSSNRMSLDMGAAFDEIPPVLDTPKSR